MKKLLFTALFFAAFSATAQVYSKGAKFVNLGANLGPIGVSGAVDLGIHETISAGVFAGYNTWAGAVLNTSRYGRISAGVRVDAHLGDILKKADIEIPQNIDPYVGAQVGLGKWNGAYIGSVAGFYTIFGGHLGARYMTKGKLGFFGEVGYDTAWLKGGITLKL